MTRSIWTCISLLALCVLLAGMGLGVWFFGDESYAHVGLVFAVGMMVTTSTLLVQTKNAVNNSLKIKEHDVRSEVYIRTGHR